LVPLVLGCSEGGTMSELSERLRAYAERLEDGEFLSEPGLAADLNDAADLLEKAEAEDND